MDILGEAILEIVLNVIWGVVVHSRIAQALVLFGLLALASVGAYLYLWA